MKKISLFLGALLAIFVFSNIASPASALNSSTQNGISIQPRSSTDFASQSFRQSVDKAVASGVNYISLVITVHQDGKYSNVVYADGSTASDDSLKSAVSYINSKGIKAGLALHDDPYDYTWRAEVFPTNPAQWFSTYGALLNRYASVAQASGASQISIATEMSSMTASSYTTNWVSMIQSVRNIYKGELTYSAQHAGYKSDVMTVGFWQYLDYIGISAYYGLDNATSKTDMIAQWKKWDEQEISVISKRYNKPVIFTEVGFVSRDGATNDPGTGYQLNTPINTKLQADAYSALFEYFANSSTVKGMFLWDWSSDPNAGGNNDGGYTPQNKPAEAVMKQWYTVGGSTTPTTPTVPATYSVNTVAPTTATTNTQVSTSLNVVSSVATSDMIVDIEIYDANNQRIAQAGIEHQALKAGTNTYSISWKPSANGSYKVKVGLFTANWASNIYWNDGAGTVISSTAATTPPTTTPPVVTPPITTPPTTPPVTTPTQPTTPPVVTPPAVLPTAINIWWPSNGSAVSGVQPFKATIEGRDASTYDMFWQVGSGVLNTMATNTDGGVHKESSVDLTGWNWEASKKYVITFIAKDKSGAIVSSKSTTITIN